MANYVCYVCMIRELKRICKENRSESCVPLNPLSSVKDCQTSLLLERSKPTVRPLAGFLKRFCNVRWSTGICERCYMDLCSVYGDEENLKTIELFVFKLYRRSLNTSSADFLMGFKFSARS